MTLVRPVFFAFLLLLELKLFLRHDWVHTQDSQVSLRRAPLGCLEDISPTFISENSL